MLHIHVIYMLMFYLLRGVCTSNFDVSIDEKRTRTPRHMERSLARPRIKYKKIIPT